MAEDAAKGVGMQSESLVETRQGARSRYLVFTSAGDRSNVHRWLRGRRDFDLWIAYYGDTPGALRAHADLYLQRKGSKFQNLHHCFQHWPDRLARYDAVMVMDDDIEIGASGISRLFEILTRLDLWSAQPAFRLCGKISWDITRVHPTAKLRYTNFIEMACPVFRRDKLETFLKAFDPELVGYGTDWWFLHTLGDLRNRVAVIDEITCVNPYDRAKGGRREIDRLQSHEDRKAVWEKMKARHGLDEQGRVHVEFGRVPQSLPGAAWALLRNLPDWSVFQAKALARRVLR